MIAAITSLGAVRWGLISALALGTVLGIAAARFWQTGTVWEGPWQ